MALSVAGLTGTDSVLTISRSVDHANERRKGEVGNFPSMHLLVKCVDKGDKKCNIHDRRDEQVIGTSPIAGPA